MEVQNWGCLGIKIMFVITRVRLGQLPNQADCDMWAGRVSCKQNKLFFPTFQ